MKQWDTLSKEEQDKRRLIQTVNEEALLRDSEVKYWNTYDVAPDEGVPEQNILQVTADLLTPVYQQWMDSVSQNSRCPEWVLPLFIVGPAKMADITIRAMIIQFLSPSLFTSSSESIGPPTAQSLATKIANMTIDVAMYTKAKAVDKENWKKQSHYQKNWTPKRCLAFAKKVAAFDKSQFTTERKQDFGHNLLRLAATSGIIELHQRVYRKGKKFGTKVHVTFSEIILQYLHSKHQDLLATASMIFRPMLVPPVLHTIENSGGFLTEYLRKPMIQRYLNENSNSSKPSSIVVSGLNHLMGTEFCINSRVLEVQETLFKGNARVANLPAFDFSAFSMDRPYPEGGTKEEISRWKADKELAYGKWYKEQQQRARMLVRLSLAKTLEHYGFFYHTYTADFRGRAYTSCELLSPQSSDFDRSLILVNQKFERTPEREKWLKVHIANLFDIDKCSFAERVQWVDDNIQLLREINDDPYGTTKIWCSDKKKKNPSFQRLAAIFDFFRTDGYTQVVPMVDGTCNGIQHWSAIMRDPDLAKQVNVIPNYSKEENYWDCDPEYLYQFIADKVTENLLAEDSEVIQMLLKHWDNKCPKDVCKRSIMCDPYGITFYGIRKYLRTEGYLDWVPKEFKAAAVNELAIQLDKALKEFLVNANKGKVWLKTVADIFSENNQYMKWKTPCGFEVLHVYNPIVSRRSRAKLFNNKELYFGAIDPDTVDKSQVNNAVAPNVIHSLDASHMWMVIDSLASIGETVFIFNHDAYGSMFMEELRNIAKEKFYEMYKENMLEELYSQFRQQLPPEVDLPRPPSVGALEIHAVLSSGYMFQ